MAYLIDTITEKPRMIKPFGCKTPFDPGLVEQADRLEIHGSSFEDPGDDWCEFKLMLGTQCIASQRCAGY